MDRLLHSDLWMHILSYVNVLDASRSLQYTSKRFFYLVTQFQSLSEAQLAAAPTAAACWSKLSRKPSLVLTFQSDDGDDNAMSREGLPPGCVVLGAVAGDVQSNMVADVGRGSINRSNNPNVTTDNSVLMASFGPDTVITPFFDELPENDNHEYDIVIVYSCGDGTMGVQDFVEAFQSEHPTATIVGGICQVGVVSDERAETGIRRVEHGIFGILARNMPLRSVVSRGVKSLSDNDPWMVQQATLVQPFDEDIFLGNEETFHRVTKLSRDDAVASPTSILSQYQPDFVGLQRRGTDGFELRHFNPAWYEDDMIAFDAIDPSESLEYAQLDLFDLSGEACKTHLDWTLAQLKRQTQGETILGALMFSCNGRGPEGGRRTLLGEEMADAKRFAQHFPDIACSGFYAGGEIGPLALANCRDKVFQKGRATVQAFTVVFALFIVPTAQRRTAYELDDSPENVANFVRERVQAR